MREIKFRVWDKERKEYLSAGTVSIEIHRGKNPEIKIILDKKLEGFKKRFILEEYTGLKDKNGKMIYEGDIIKIYDNVLDDTTTAEVEFDDAAFCVWSIDGYQKLYGEMDIEIIGNIHQNKELLK